MPLLSIVIANYNYGRFLGEAIESVVAQLDFAASSSAQSPNQRPRTAATNKVPADLVELIICDGGSTDNSVDVIKQYVAGLPPNTERTERGESPVTWWCSEPDGGQSAAFNKGFSHAHGRFLTWLNADDVMLPGTLTKLAKSATKHPDCEWFVGGVLWLDPEMHVINCGRGRRFSEIRYREGNVCVWGPSSFFTKRLLDVVGGVDERFCFTMDTDLWLRFAFKANARYLPFCDYAWGLRLHPDAKMSGHNFTADGKFDVEHTEAQKIAASKHHSQMMQETAWRNEYFKAKPSTRLSHLRSASWPSVLAARFNLLRWRGKLYTDVFK